MTRALSNQFIKRTIKIPLNPYLGIDAESFDVIKIDNVHDQPHTSDKKFVQISLKYLSRKYKYRCAVLVITKLIFKSISVNLNLSLKSNG